MRHRNIGWAVGVLGMALLGSNPVGAATFHVATNGNDGADGSSWTLALLTISNAIARAGDGDTILVSNGTYAVTHSLTITNSIALVGANGATGTTLQAASGVQIGVLNHAGAVWEGFRLTGCNLNYMYHGAIQVQAGTLRNCIISGNYIGDGAGVHLIGGLVTDCTISNNNSYWDSNGWGGGAYVTGGVLSNCVIVGNTGEMGGGVYMSGGLVTRCVITNNVLDPYSGSQGGAGVRLAGGTLANCLVARNRIGNVKSVLGGGVYMTGGALVHCTVADNSLAGGTEGAGLYMTAGTVTNSIMYHNSSVFPSEGRENVYATGGSIVYSCTQPLTNHTGNTELSPDFIDRDAGNYRLAYGSACIDSGTNIASITLDLDGAGRPRDGDADGVARPDRGCYEADTVTVFTCSFRAEPVTGLVSMPAVLTAQVAGPGTDSVVYVWDFTDDGTPDEAGTSAAVVSNTYVTGYYSVRLTCTNSLGQTASLVRSNYLIVYSDQAYVATNGGHVPPYDSWAKAATNLQSAINAVYSPGIVWVSNGSYTLGQALDITRAVAVRSLAGPSNTTIRVGGALEILKLNHANAVVTGFRMTGSSGLSWMFHGAVKVQSGTLSNCIISGNSVGSGGGVHLIGGLVSDCTISNNVSYWDSNGDGGGAYVTGGTLSNCWVVSNDGENGGGVFLTGGLVTRCVITGNVLNAYSGASQGGSGVRMSGGTLANCLVARNRIPAGKGTNGAGIYLSGGSVLNCTIVHNGCADNEVGSGVYLTAGGMTNSILYFNGLNSPAVTNQNIRMTGGLVSYCDTDPAVGGVSNLNADPRFMSTNLFNYRLHRLSPCINAGLLLPGMAKALDLAGASRVQYGAVDLGAYEAPPPVSGILVQVR